jgi:hypothetical protein
MLKHLTMLCLLTISVAATFALPPCNYTNPNAFECTRYSGGILIESKTISCRSIGNNGPPEVSGESSCEYFWCDNNMPCSTNGNSYRKNKRTKRYGYRYNISSCDQMGTVINVSDEEVDCCMCQMPVVGPTSGP